ncbi:MAG: hypothetical protein IPL67_04885 [Ignavibacteria bacterium]|nr:hypothetical protein [Ignavibacteria bacterium]
MKIENGKLESGKWKMENGNLKVENGKLKMENGKWKGYSNIFCHPEQAERSEGSIQVKDPYKCKEKSIELNNTKMESGKWKMENGKWKMENGKLKIEVMNLRWQMGINIRSMH